MRRLSLVTAGLTAAAIVLLAGCSTAVTGAPEPSKVTESVSTPGTATTALTDETGTTDPTSDDPAGSSSVNGLDGSTELYFATFCISADELAQKLATLGDIDEADYPAEELQTTYVTTLTEAAGIAGNSVGVLGEAPTPEFPDSAQVQASAIERFTSLETVLTRGAANIEGLVVPGKSELRSALDVVNQEVTQAVNDSAVDIDDDVLTAAREIPECTGVGL